MLRYRLALILFSILILVSCASQTGQEPVLVQRLKNRGPIVLSTHNPYLAANMLLSSEIESSRELKGFIEHRGAPPAIEVQKVFLEEADIRLYYPRAKEFYLLEWVNGAWLIQGPQALEERKLLELRQRGVRGGEDPVFLTPIRTPTALEEPPSAEGIEFGAGSEEGLVSRKESMLAGTGMESSTADIQNSFSSPAAGTEQAAALVDIISRYGRDEAELTPKGDLVHYVTSERETLALLALWYTEDASNTGRLARMNNLSSSRALEPGDTVIIPKYLLRNTKRLSDEALDSLRRFAEK